MGFGSFKSSIEHYSPLSTNAPTSINIIAPGAGVEVFLRVRVRVALNQLNVVLDRFVDGHP